MVEGTKVSSAETETIVDAYLKRQQVAPTGEDVPRDQIAKWVLEYQIRLTVRGAPGHARSASPANRSRTTARPPT